MPTSTVDEVCQHGHRQSDEPPGVEHVVRWICMICGATTYSDDALRRLRASLDLARSTVATLSKTMREASETLAETVDDFTA